MINPFKDRNVAVIGNAKQEIPSLIDYDTIVCCNRWRPCQVFFFDGHPEWEQFEPKPDPLRVEAVYIYGLRDDARDCALWCKERKIPWEYYSPPGRCSYIPTRDMTDTLWWSTPLERALGCRPLTGFLAIFRALQLGAKSVFVTGMDLYQTNGHFPFRVGPHDIPKHAQWLHYASIASPRLILDDPLRKLLLDNICFGDNFRESLPTP